ncbi:MAG TPA: amino acid adenylation domain-containing protein, partial [Methanospirillum sp.]|uniref:non-ribosomal peptide synthetase family protein n=1 Tax=Methanospirillum sp. TaxID=45200 RepID=UPI002CBAC7CE
TQVIHSFFTRFDLEKAPLVKVKLVQCSPEHFILLLNIHHIIADGMSISLIFDELSRIYSGQDLKPPAFQFQDYAVWLNTLEKEGLLKENDSFWIKYLTGYRPAELLTDNERPKVPDFTGKSREFILDSDLTISLHNLIEKSETTLHSTLMGIIGLLYSIYTQQKDVVIGTTTNGRGPEGSDSVVGMFVETIPVRLQVTDDLPVIAYLQQVRDNLFDLYDHQPFSLSRVYETVAETRGPGRHPFIDLNVIIQNMEENSFVAEGISSTRQIYDLNLVKFDISIAAWEKEGHIFFKIDYRSPLFSDDTIRYLELHLLSLIRSILSDSSKNAGDYELIDDEERAFLLNEVNNTKTPLPEWITIGEAVTRSCLQYPEKRAIVAPDGCITYRELNIISDRIAGKIFASVKDANIRHDSIIGIIGDRSFLTVAAMVGALKADTPYVVLDPGYPEDRIRFILDDTKACLLIGSKKSLEILSCQYSGPKINLDTLTGDVGDDSDDTQIPVPSPYDLAYLIYTSGSTGKPKGVMIEHHSMVNFIAWYTRHHQFDSGSRSLEFASLSFDVSVVQIFAPLVTGGELHIIPESLRLSPHDLDRYCEENRITHAHFPTQFAEQFIQVCSNISLKRLVVGGDRLNRYKLGTYQLVNEYGPTETTMASTSTEIQSVVPNPPIGYPIANTRIYVLGTGGTLLPIGIPGELYIAGEGVSRGYLNNPDLTSEKFLPDPFVPGERMYRTGDRARIRSDGMLEYIGRIDFQVKIRGYRIEPGEIESAIRTIPGINNAVVLPIDDPSIGKYLCGYYEADSPLAESELKSSMRRILPEYMIPARFVHLVSFPLNRNGKVDRKLLPGPNTIQSCDTSYEYPRNQTEQLIADAWKKVLGKSCISITDDFFDIGADSLRAIALLIELEKNFKVSISDIFSFRTIADQAASLPRSESGFADRIPLLINLLQSPERTPDVIGKETAYTDTIHNFDWNNCNLELKRDYKTILLTGVTGTLGGYLLRDLLELTDYDVVVIARGHDHTDAQNRVTRRMEESFGSGCLKPYLKRVSVVQGDLSSDHCGLDDDTWDRLSLQVDVIIHSAALTKHIGDYQEFYKANVLSTQNLLSLCLHGNRKDFHYISTVSVGSGLITESQGIFFSEDSLDIGQELENPYVKSKFEAEKLVQNARKQGLITTIFRAGNITFDSETGSFQQNVEDNAFFQQIRAYVNLGLVPDQYDQRN